ncbi:MAG: XdhC family protein [Roseibacillus sp.]
MSDWPLILGFAKKHREKKLALATLVGREGSSYRTPGARLLITENGEYSGSLSGGCLEEGIAHQARKVISTGIPHTENIDTRPHFGCPGTLKIFTEALPNFDLLDDIDKRLNQRQSFTLVTNSQQTTLTHHAKDEGYCEQVSPPIRLIAIGSTSDLNPVFAFANTLGWQCHRIVPDARLAAETPITASELLTSLSPSELLNKLPPDSQTAALVMTHHLATDLAYLKELFPANYGYLGLLGSKRRRETLLSELGELGLLENQAAIARFHAPVGLDIGASHPNSIALAIVAEIQASLNQRQGGFLRDRLLNIHSPISSI